MNIECPMCFNNYSEELVPRYLKCNHSACTNCLKNLKKFKKIRCPFCSEIQDVNYVIDLPINHDLIQGAPRKKIKITEVESNRKHTISVIEDSRQEINTPVPTITQALPKISSKSLNPGTIQTSSNLQLKVPNTTIVQIPSKTDSITSNPKSIQQSSKRELDVSNTISIQAYPKEKLSAFNSNSKQSYSKPETIIVNEVDLPELFMNEIELKNWLNRKESSKTEIKPANSISTQQLSSLEIKKEEAGRNTIELFAKSNEVTYQIDYLKDALIKLDGKNRNLWTLKE